VDDMTCENMPPHLEWHRSKTTARGDGYCDFCFFVCKRTEEKSKNSKKEFEK
jgi:hypothetical protein